MIARAAGMFSLATFPQTVTVLFVYPCKDCRGWHLTKNRSPAYYAVTADDPYPTLTGV